MIDTILDAGIVYRIWQAPFARQKFAPVARALAGRPPRSVLDIGCGPGTNASYFRSTSYVGIDLNPRYVAAARKRFGDRFVVGDATRGLPDLGAPYDCIVVNSLLHHLDDAQVDAVLSSSVTLLANDGEVQILDLELPSERSAARFLALRDRGDHPRPRDEWQRLLGRSLAIRTFEPFPLGVAGRALWRMFHCRAGARAEGRSTRSPAR